MDKLPHVWRSAKADSIVVVYPNKTEQYKMVEKDKGEDRMPKPLNSRYAGQEVMGYYTGWTQLAHGKKRETKLPVAFKRNDIVELVYKGRTEIYRKSNTYAKGSNGRIYDEMNDEEYEKYYRGNGYRRVAPK